MTERNRFLRGMTVWVGFTQTAVSYERDARHAGETKYTLRKMLRFSLDAIASFSHLPLQIATYLGFLFAGVAFIAIPIVIALTAGRLPTCGFGSITIAILLLGGIQLIAIGVIGEYVGRIYDEVKHRPLYIVRDQRNEPHLPTKRPPTHTRHTRCGAKRARRGRAPAGAGAAAQSSGAADLRPEREISRWTAVPVKVWSWNGAGRGEAHDAVAMDRVVAREHRHGAVRALAQAAVVGGADAHPDDEPGRPDTRSFMIRGDSVGGAGDRGARRGASACRRPCPRRRSCCLPGRQFQVLCCCASTTTSTTSWAGPARRAA